MLYARVIVKKRTRVEELTYTVPARILPHVREGTVVTVPLRRKKVPAVVVSLVSRIKASLKPKLRAISDVERDQRRFSPEAITVIHELANYYGAALAEVAFHALKKPAFITAPNKLSEESKPIFLQGPSRRRFKAYLQLASRLGSRRALFLFATRREAGGFSRQLAATCGDMPRITIGTVGEAFHPLAWGDVIVVDQPYHIGSTSRQRPFMSSRRIAEIRSQVERLQLVLGSPLVAVEDFKRLETDWQLKVLTTPSMPAFISDRRGGREIVLPSLVERMRRVLARRGKALALVLSRGLASALVCEDCGRAFTCQACQRTISLHAQELVCSYCAHRQSRPDRCPVCRSVRLSGVGEGAASFVAALRRLFPSASIQQLSTDFPDLDPKSQIVVATEKILSFLEVDFDELFLLSVDRHLSGAEMNGSWRLLSDLIELRSRSGAVSVQTYFPDHPVWSYLASGNWQDYFKSELAQRRLLRLPPFGSHFSLVGREVSAETARRQAIEVERRLRELLPKADVSSLEIVGRSGHRLLVRLQVLLPGGFTARLKKTVSANLPPSWSLIVA